VRALLCMCCRATPWSGQSARQACFESLSRCCFLNVLTLPMLNGIIDLKSIREQAHDLNLLLILYKHHSPFEDTNTNK
jgi:hypothetical protein